MRGNIIRLDKEYRGEALRTERAALTVTIMMLNAVGESIGIGRMAGHVMRRPGVDCGHDIGLGRRHAERGKHRRARNRQHEQQAQTPSRVFQAEHGSTLAVVICGWKRTGDWTAAAG